LKAKIEQATIAEGIAMVRLETGVLQKAAIGLYESLGYLSYPAIWQLS
jgi:ribosomal protein S18 acetylase RimI-like enzyme